MRLAIIPLTPIRSAVFSSLAWLGALQSINHTAPDDLTRIAGVAGVLGTLTVLVYRLGVWRQEMEHTKNNVAATVTAHRDETAASFVRLEQRLEAIDHVLAATSDQQVKTTRWRARTERRLEQLERTERARFDPDGDVESGRAA